MPQKLRFRKTIASALLLAVLVLIPALNPVFAQTDNQKSGGVTIAPAFQELTVQGSKGRTEGTFALTNNEKVAVDFTISSVDMGVLDDTGGVIFSGLPADYQKRYGLAEWIELPKTKITVAAEGKQEIQFFIKNSDKFQPGGHYGAIIVRPVINTQVSAEGNKINLSPQAATLLFVKKVGGEVYKLEFVKTYFSSSVWRVPEKTFVELKNAGNVHVVPRGVVQIKNWRGNLVGQGVLNTESAVILPERNRIFTVQLKFFNRFVLPGKYRAVIQYRYEGQEEFQTTEISLVIINLPFVLGLLILAVGMFFLGKLVIGHFGGRIKDLLLTLWDKIIDFVKKIVPNK